MSKAIDWVKLGWCMTKPVQVGSEATSMFVNGPARFGAFKAESDAVTSAFIAANARSTKIDFQAYKDALPSQKAWIEKMEKEYNQTVVPKPKDTLSSSIAKDQPKVSKYINDTSKHLDEAAIEAAEDLRVLKALPPVEQLTRSDIYTFMPELNPFTEEKMDQSVWVAGFDEVHINKELEEKSKAKWPELDKLYMVNNDKVKVMR